MLLRLILWNSAHQNASLALFLLNNHPKYTTPADKVNPQISELFNYAIISGCGRAKRPNPRSSKPSIGGALHPSPINNGSTICTSKCEN